VTGLTSRERNRLHGTHRIEPGAIAYVISAEGRRQKAEVVGAQALIKERSEDSAFPILPSAVCPTDSGHRTAIDYGG